MARVITSRAPPHEITASQDPNKSTSKSPRRASTSVSQAPAQTTCDATMLARLLSAAGHVAFRQLVLLYCDVFNELKRRREVKEKKSSSNAKKNQAQGAKEKPMTATGSRRRPAKPSEADDGQALEEELGLAGASEEDAEAEFSSKRKYCRRRTCSVCCGRCSSQFARTTGSSAIPSCALPLASLWLSS